MWARLAWSAAAVVLAAAAWAGPLDAAGRESADQAFRRALVTFAVARTLNGVISVAQGTEVAVEPAGVGVNFSIGEVLDPVNDLVERFSGLMLVASSSLGLQKVLLLMSGWWGVTAAVAGAAAILLLSLWLPATRGGRLQVWALRALLLASLLRFAVPLLLVGSGLVFDTFLAESHAEATAALENASADVSRISESAPAPQRDDSMLGRLNSLLDQSLEAVNVDRRLEEFRERMAEASEHVIELIVIFTLETILLPVGLLWLLITAVRALAARAMP